MSTIDRTIIIGRRPAAPGRAGAVLRRAAASVAEAAQRLRGRRALMELNDRLLKDIGLTRADVDRECAKPFWRP